MNHLKASILRKEYIKIAEDEKQQVSARPSKKKQRPSSSIKSLNEVASAHDLYYENPPLNIYNVPRRHQGVLEDKQTVSNHLSNRAVLRNIEKEARYLEQERMKQTIEIVTSKEKEQFSKDELEEVIETTRTKFYNRPMTAVNMWRKRNTRGNELGEFSTL